ncbi:hypothetical protein J6590_030000 [Homalodisca vitripennis]|nr:hypothetical protein J6590_030000 [Homalodisca vitripennis]
MAMERCSEYGGYRKITEPSNVERGCCLDGNSPVKHGAHCGLPSPTATGTAQLFPAPTATGPAQLIPAPTATAPQPGPAFYTLSKCILRLHKKAGPVAVGAVVNTEFSGLPPRIKYVHPHYDRPGPVRSALSTLTP